MSDSKTIPELVLEKTTEQVERALHLVAMVPSGSLEWRPLQGAMRVGDLLGHLLDCLAGFCAALHAVDKERLAHFARLCELRVNHCCGVKEAEARIKEYMAHIEEGFGILSEADLTRRLPTLFTPEGEAVLTLLLDNLEHFINHKHQLFFYLKMMGEPVTTRDLYHFRE